MSGIINREGDSCGAEISERYLASFRLALRITSQDLDGEIIDLIRAAREDLALAGISFVLAAAETDPLIKRAIVTYVKAEFGLDNEDAEQYRVSYQRQKVALAMSSAYTGLFKEE